MRPPPDSSILDFTLAQICKLHRARAHTLLEELGLYHGQPPMLFALWEQEGQTHGELAARLHIAPATATKMIQRMEKAGFVERRPDAEDQRVSRVFVTEAGRAIHARVEQVWQRIDGETFAGFSMEERQMLQGFFLRIRENLVRVTGGSPNF